MIWQPIETAPEDDIFLVCNARYMDGIGADEDSYKSGCAVVYRSGGDLIAYFDDDTMMEHPYLDGPPTHWMPLPRPPAP